MKFPYRAYEVAVTPASGRDNGYVRRPVIPFTLHGPEGTLDFYGLLDTGADETYITRQMADRLGIKTTSDSEYFVESASGLMSVDYGFVIFEITDGIETYVWQTVVGVTDQEWAEAILGHSGVLQFFDVEFRGHERELIVTRNQAALPPSGIES